MEIMKALNNKTAKKNQSIIRVTPWNHHFGSDDFGRRSNNVDEYKADAVEIFSIGKKQMIIGNASSIRPSDEKMYCNPDGNFLCNYAGTVHFFVFDESEIEECIANIRKHDGHATPSFRIVK